MMGKLSEEGGMDSETTSRNTAIDSSTVTFRETFSPDSTGRIKPKAATVEVTSQGNIIVIR